MSVCGDERVAVAALTSGYVVNTNGVGLNCLLDDIRKQASKKGILLFGKPVAGELWIDRWASLRGACCVGILL